MKWLWRVSQFALYLAVSGVYAQDNWVVVSRTSTTIFEARTGSLEHTFTEQNREPIVALVLRVRNTTTATVEFEKNYVRLADCRAGFGKLVATDLSGRAKYDNEFIFDGGNAASTIAETLCRLAGVSPGSQPSNIAPGKRF
jgi:hypothetical protein